MTLSLAIPVSLLAVHFVADFILQNDWMAVQKSKRLDALTVHVGVYAVTFGLLYGWPFGLVTFLTHFATDFWTSKASRRLFPFIIYPLPDNTTANLKLYEDLEGTDGRSRHWFFVCIGADQLIHYLTLAVTYKWLIQ